MSARIPVLCIRDARNLVARPPDLEASAGLAVQPSETVAEAVARLAAGNVDAVVAWFPLPDWTPAELLEEVQKAAPEVPVLVLDPEGTLADAVRLGRLGVSAFFIQPPPAGELAASVEAAVEDRRSRQLAALGCSLQEQPWRKWLVGESRAIRKVLETIRLVGPRRCTVLLTGETGTGKEMAARALHGASPRRHAPMVTVNCSALPEHLLEAELFGHVKGAFTGAVSHRVGRFEQADGSTLFLDEIGEMPLDLQAKLLRVLQEREFQRVGSSETTRVDIRVVAASNTDLLQRVRQGSFREDLYYRLNVVPLEIPPLRERSMDVPLLVRHFIEKICRLEGMVVKQVHRETLDRLRAYSWPGNVRQLENAVEMAVALSGDREVLYAGDFPLPSRLASKPAPAGSPFISVPEDGLDFEATVGALEKHILTQALERTGGNKKRAADMLRLKRTTLAAKLRSLEAAPGWN